jgi:uncharacterized membrane protein
MRIVLLASLLAVWGLALAAWPELPDRIPVHFDALGRPDGWAARHAAWWFLLPGLGTVLGVGVGILLPRWMVALARANSPWLNVPRKREFMALSADARERAVRAPAACLTWLAIMVQVLLGWIVHGSARVAVGDWTVLPPVPTFVLIGGLLAIVAALVVAGARAVGREVERARS